MPGSSVGKALVSHTGVQGSIPTSDMQSFFNKYLQLQLLISLSRNLSCSNVEYSKSASVDCMHPLFSKNQSQLSCFKYKIMLSAFHNNLGSSVDRVLAFWFGDWSSIPTSGKKSFSGKIFLICFLKSVFHPTFPNSKRGGSYCMYIKELIKTLLKDTRSHKDTAFLKSKF